jgi:asparagine synthase (glutamine-hydrolysing)
MCGINGYKHLKKKLPDFRISDLIQSMNDCIIHRGPDEDGVFVNDRVGLGMRRLSIIDLTTGKQPVYSPDKSLVILLNGEIYNYKSLRSQLENKGHTFRTTSDTEVALITFLEYGTDSFNMLNGMFAIAIYDLNNRCMYLARDRAGEKPLYYYKSEDHFIFGSELKSLIHSGLIPKEISKKALNQYLRLTYIPSPLSIFKNVFKLPAGHYMRVDDSGEISIRQYWDVIYDDSVMITDYETCKKELRKTLFHAVEECMVADVPFGAFLSGGIDSTIITGLMSKISDKKINTFNIGFHDKQFDESGRARVAAQLHQTHHQTYFLDYDEVVGELGNIVANIDEPFADSSLIPTYAVSKFARKHVKTVLTGDAGDELFGGYNKYLIGYYANRYKKIPGFIRKEVIERMIYSLPDTTAFTRKARKVVGNAELDIYSQRLSMLSLGFKNDELQKLLRPEWNDEASLDAIREHYDRQDTAELSKTLYTDLKVVLEGDMLAKVDRASMLCSLETRVPMLHKDVIELAAKIPSDFKINTKKTKIILKDTFSDLIPDELLNAPKKGFSVPVGSWFKNELKEELMSTIGVKRKFEIPFLNYDYVEEVINEHTTNKKNRSSELWVLYVLAKWYEKNQLRFN